VVVSIARADTFRNGSINDGRFGYVRTTTNTKAESAFSWSDIGVAEGAMSNNNELPSLVIQGSVSIASGFPRDITQNSFFFGDVYSFVDGAHTLRLGGSINKSSGQHQSRRTRIASAIPQLAGLSARP